MFHAGELPRFLLLVSCIVLPWLALAQENEAAADSDTNTPEIAPSVVYIELPVVLHAGQDPLLPPPVTLSNPEAEPDFAARAASIETYTDSVEEIESSGGAWDPNLIESLSALGNLQQAQGEHLPAIQSFERALHVNRINDGLHTVAQVSLVEQLIESHIALQDWDSADLYFDYLLYIQLRAFGADDPRLIPLLNRLGAWHVQMFEQGVGDPVGLRLSNAVIYYHAAVRLLGEHFGNRDPRYIGYLQNIADVGYLIASNSELMGEIDKGPIRNQQDALREALNEETAMMPSGFRVGEAALLELISLAIESGDSTRQAEAYTHLGDWYLFAERRRRAEEQYAVAWNLLVDPPIEEGEAEPTAPAQQPELFAQVAIIPSHSQRGRWLTRPGLERPALGALQWQEVDLSFTVSRNGQVRDIEILSEETEENAGHFARVSRELRRYRFRPVIEDGQLIESGNNQARVRFWY